MGEINWERLCARLVCLFAFVALFVLGFRYLVPILLPFFVAWGISLAVRPLAEKIAGRTRLPRKLCAAVLLVLLLSISVFLLYQSCARLILELRRLLERLLTENNEIGLAVRDSIDFFEAVTSKIGFLRRIRAGERFAIWREKFNGMIAEMLEGVLRSLSAELPTFVGRVLSALPDLFLVGAVTLISAFYFCMDEEGPAKSLQRILPSTLAKRLPAWKARIKGMSWKYLKAYLVLLLLTFSELFLGFTVLRIDYAFLLSALVAVVDMLPVLGVGTVLVPWALVLLLQKKFYVGCGLLILYLVMLFVRQILEPRLIGKSLGIHPLVSLFASYAGWQLFGLLGMVFGPIVATVLQSVFGRTRTVGGREN